MTCKERLRRMAAGGRNDRVPFMPTILEHAAALLGRTPSECAQDSRLMADAHVAAWKRYGHDAVTVGIDVYNIEAEALGCEVRYYTDSSVPGIVSHPYGLTSNPFPIHFSPESGRIPLVLDAASSVAKSIGDEVDVGVGICGPFSIAVELVGFEMLIEGIADECPWVRRLLESVTAHQIEYGKEILRRGLGLVLFDSWATPPLVSPNGYREFIAPYERSLILALKDMGFKSVPLVIGGDTRPIVQDISSTGTTTLLSDYMTDIQDYLPHAIERGLVLRGNLDPSLLVSATPEEITREAEMRIAAASGYSRFVLGTGVVPYDALEHSICAIRTYLEKDSDMVSNR